MNKKDFMDWFRTILITLLIVFLGVGGIVGLMDVGHKNRERNCAELGEQIGYNTAVFSTDCLIEIRPNLWVSEREIVGFLPLIDCEKE